MQKDRIAILTYHNTRNYGAILQCYALQTIMKRLLKCDCDVLNYDCKYLSDVYKIKKIYENTGVKELVKWLLMNKHEKKLQCEFKKFMSDNIKLSPRYDSTNIINANDSYSVFVTGSDQVWNGKLNGNDENYYLSFVNENNLRFSYAASFGGSHLNKFEKYMIKNELPKFKAISVREENAITLINSNESSNIEACLVLDPTLLLTYSDWLGFVSKNDFFRKRKYILVYLIADTPSILSFAKKLAKVRKLDVICIHKSYRNFGGVTNVKDASVYEFLNYVYNAEYVVSSSFHGICFSINFHKNFFYELDNRKINNNSRIESLIGITNLKNREIVNGNNLFINDSIDYDEVEKKLKSYRDKSYEFIENIKSSR